MEYVVGIDGCRSGWVVVTAPIGCLADATAERVEALRVVDLSRAAVVAIDIPLGLPDSSRRASDAVVRTALGPRRSSLFPTPSVAAVDAESYSAANAANRGAVGVGLSKQSWHLVPKIREARSALLSVQRRSFEALPELSFALLTGSPFDQPKSTATGLRSRIEAIAGHVPCAEAAPPTGAKQDDLADAAVLAWTAQRIVDGVAQTFGDPAAFDDEGWPMSVVG